MFDGLYEELEKVSIALDQGCKVTAKAAMLRAYARLREDINETTGAFRDYAEAAHAYIVEEARKAKKYVEEVELLTLFWAGFIHGWEDEERPEGDDSVFLKGYDFGRYGGLGEGIMLPGDG